LKVIDLVRLEVSPVCRISYAVLLGDVRFSTETVERRSFRFQNGLAPEQVAIWSIIV